MLGVTTFIPAIVSAQCQFGESEVIVTIVEDNFGSETTWLVHDGTDTVFSGGPYSNGNSGQSHIESYCFANPVNLIFIINDAYGDGICCGAGNGSYTIEVDSFEIANGGQFGSTDSVIFNAPLPANDAAIFSIDTRSFLLNGTQQLMGSIRNQGTDTITSVEIGYTDNGGVPVTATLPVFAAPFSTYPFVHPVEWCAKTGNHLLQVWVENPNGMNDEIPANNSSTKQIQVVNTLAEKMVLSEHFTQASCIPCAVQNPYYDTLLTNNPGMVASIKYHTYWPGIDPMHSLNPFDPDARVSYYGVSTVPEVVLDGNKWRGPPSAITNTHLNELKNVLAPFHITFNESISGQTITINATLSCLINFTGMNVKVHVALVEEMVSYITPPGSNGEMDFPQVLRKMLPNASGTTWSAPQMNDQLTINETYTVPSSVDASQLRTVIFVQNDSNKDVLQAFMSTVQSGTSTEQTTTISGQDCGTASGINTDDVVNIESNIYPNPAADQINLQLNLVAPMIVTFEIINAMGKVVVNENLGTIARSTHSYNLNINHLTPGVYLAIVHAGDMSMNHSFVKERR